MRFVKLAFPFVIFLLVVAIIVGDNLLERDSTEVELVDADSDAPLGAAGTASMTALDPICGMSVEVKADTPSRRRAGKVFHFCHKACAEAFERMEAVPILTAEEGSVSPSDVPADASPSAGSAAGELDPVCHMLVGQQIPATYKGKHYYFCAPQCRAKFEADPESFMGEVCAVCDVDDGKRVAVTAESKWCFTWQDKTYRFCSAEHRDRFGEDPGGYFLHRMWGIPNWLYYLCIALVMLVSFGILEWIDRYGRASDEKSDRLDLLAWGPLRKLAASRLIRTVFQLVIVMLFFMIVFAGLLGNQQPSRNIAPILTWTIWWAGLVVVILYAGKVFCWTCPWDAISSWIERLAFWRPASRGMGLGLKWPRQLRNIVLATVLFVGLTWVELGFGVTLKPAATAYLALAMLAMTFLAVMVFERKSFCRYGCLVGRVSGLYALFSPMEMRPRDRAVCGSCKTTDCYKGNEKGDGCPTFELPAKMTVNTYCTLCAECLHSCPHDNMTLNLRPWGADLNTEGKPRTDEAYLALLMLSITGFHGLTMTGLWLEWTGWISDNVGLPFTAAFSLGMFVLMAAPIGIYAGLVWVSRFLARRGPLVTSDISYMDYFIRYAYALLPIALFYHLAHNAGHLLMEGQKVLPMLSNPFGYAPGESWNVMGIAGVGPWNLFGTADWHVPPLVSLPALWLIQVLLVLVGHVYSLWAAQRVSKQLFPNDAAATRSQLPMLAAMILFSIFSLWLLKQPMEMRVSAM